MVQVVCGWLCVVFLVIGFFGNVYRDFHGRGGSEPLGFAGFVSSVIVTVIAFLLLWGAGAFDKLMGG